MRNILFCVTGPSGSGKTTIMRSIMDNELLSFTTRQMREGEVNGKDYIFIKEEQFKNMLDGGALAEYTKYDGNYYGLTLEELLTKTEEKPAFFVCNNHGLQQIREKYDNIVSIFLYAEEEDCFDNMTVSRKDDSNKALSRLNTYDDEIANRGQYDYVIKNIRGLKHVTEGIVQLIVATEIARRNTDEPTNTTNA